MVVTKIVIEKEQSQFSIIFVLASQYRSHSVLLDNAVSCPRWFLSMCSWRLHSMQHGSGRKVDSPPSGAPWATFLMETKWSTTLALWPNQSILPNVCSPKATSKIVEVAAAFFHSSRQNMMQTCCSFKRVVFYVQQNYKRQKALVTMHYSKIHKLKLYSKQKMNQQTLLFLHLVARKVEMHSQWN